MRSRTIALSWKDPEVRARRIAGMVRNNKNTEYRSRQSAIRKKFLAYNPKAMEDWLSATRLGRNVALGKDVAEKRSVSLAKIRETPAFKLAHRVGIVEGVHGRKVRLFGICWRLWTEGMVLLGEEWKRNILCEFLGINSR